MTGLVILADALAHGMSLEGCRDRNQLQHRAMRAAPALLQSNV
jgi:hypothetical protein